MRDSWGNFKDRYVFGAIGLGLVVFIVAIALLCWKLSSRECHIAELQYHKGTHYFFLGGGCYIETERGIKIELDQFQNFKQVH